MVVRNNEEVERIQQKLKERLVMRKELKSSTSENEKEIKQLESYLAFLIGKPVGEISTPNSIPIILLEILKTAGRPLHAKELVEALRRSYPGYENTAHQTVTGALIRYVNNKKRFKRVAPNVYDVLKEDEENLGQ
jgi:hypothetical protein